ncbi:MAG TPA: hypothetical protein VJY62_18600, partial [Bacteroidia bacterium]|nr:hypothetical protein [Bacteroidia bacterium]
MKKLLLFSLLIRYPCISNAQNYIPIPESNATWNIHEQGYYPCSFGNYQWGNQDLSLSISGDTIINSITYKKLYGTGHFYTSEIIGVFCNDNISNYFTNVYCGAFRNDTLAKQVMFIRSGFATSECVMFDFSLNSGDSLNSMTCGPTWGNPMAGIVLADTFIVYGGQTRHVFLLKYNDSGFSYETSTIIEGIGSLSAGLFDAYHHFEWSSALLCFAINDTTVYPGDTTACDEITEIKEWSLTKSDILIYPNPVLKFLTIENGVSGATIDIENLLGVNLLTQKINSP